jgi:hypothetical protein
VCKLCQSAVHPSAIGTYLRRSHARYHSSLASKKQIWTFTNEILLKVMEMSLLDPRSESVILPAIEQTPLPYLRVCNGFGYSYYSLLSQAVDKMRSYYNTAHAPERRSCGGPNALDLVLSVST